ncbi:unnamed protein product [Gemmata massiliana]|uniref:Uncharacterized protein n=1 Tax=Gemmata massiliana TaxID=1210884 RepID=A0A6P2CWF8_9BACT|nr:hypothetical protein [Gemmata massiliana]VTR92937.1 unnamed protein product [Gemmata massiliana]
MRVTVDSLGDADVGTRDRALVFDRLPEGAYIRSAALAVEPFGPLEIACPLTGAPLPFGFTKDAGPNWIVVDFHSRQTIKSVTVKKVSGPTPTPKATVQIFLGGTWLSVGADGTIAGKPELSVDVGTPIAIPPLAADRVKFTGAATDQLDVDSLTLRTVPTNVTAAVGNLPPFWVRPGELAVADSSPGFAAVFNSYLTKAKPEQGRYRVPFTVHADGLCRLRVTLTVDYEVRMQFSKGVRFHFQQGPYPKDVVDLRTALANNKALTFTIPAGATILDANTKVEGGIEPPHAPLLSLTGLKLHEQKKAQAYRLVRELHLAQPLLLDSSRGAIAAFDCRLSNTGQQPVTLRLRVQGDLGGKPSGEVLVTTDFVVPPDGPVAVWRTIPLAAPLPIRSVVAGRPTPLWLLWESIDGEVVLLLNAEADRAILCSDDQGFSWRGRCVLADPAPPADPILFRVRQTLGVGPGVSLAVFVSEPTRSGPPYWRCLSDIALAAFGDLSLRATVFSTMREKFRLPAPLPLTDGATEYQLRAQFQTPNGGIPFDHAEIRWLKSSNEVATSSDLKFARDAAGALIIGAEVNEISTPSGSERLSGAELNLRVRARDSDDQTRYDSGDNDTSPLAAEIFRWVAKPVLVGNAYRVLTNAALRTDTTYRLYVQFRVKSDKINSFTGFSLRWFRDPEKPLDETNEILPRQKLLVTVGGFAWVEWTGQPPEGAKLVGFFLLDENRPIDILDSHSITLTPALDNVQYSILPIAEATGEVELSELAIHYDPQL